MIKQEVVWYSVKEDGAPKTMGQTVFNFWLKTNIMDGMR